MKKHALRIVSLFLSAIILFSILSVGVSGAGIIPELTLTTENYEKEKNSFVENLVINSNDVNTPLIIKDSDFWCGALKSVTFIGEGDIIIESYAFYYCNRLESISFESTGDIIFKGIHCFAGTAIKELYLPSNVKFERWYDSEYDGYDYCSYLFEDASLEKVTIACDISSYVFAIFFNCVNLKTVSFIEDGAKITKIPSSCFANCPLTSIDIPDTVTYIDNLAFYGGEFKSVAIPESVTTIVAHSFVSCNNLKSIYIPPTVTKINFETFGWKDETDSIVGGWGYENIEKVDGFTIYGHTGSAAETYAVDNGFTFIPVDNIDSSISSAQATTGTVGSPSPVTLSVAGFPDYITTKSSLGSTQTITREDAEIVTTESGEEWTFDVVPESETTEFTVTATYCGGSLTAISEIAITAQKADTTTVKSVETTVPAVVGNTATVSVTVAESAEAIRFVNADSETITFGRETETVTDNGDTTETWTVSVPVTKETEEYTVYAKYAQTGWSTEGTEFTLKARVLNYSTEIESIEFEESLDGVIYQGVNKMTIVTADGMTKVQLMKDGNTWTYNENNATYEDKDGQRIWTINMNFSQLGDHTYDIRVRSAKTTFQTADTLDLTVYAR